MRPLSCNLLSTKTKKTVSSADSCSDEEVTKQTSISQSLKKKWIVLELPTLKSAFSQFLKDTTYPSGNIMVKEIMKHPCLKDRTVAQ